MRTLTYRKVLRSKKAGWPPKGYLKFPLEASLWLFQVGPLHNLLQAETLLNSYETMIRQNTKQSAWENKERDLNLPLLVAITKNQL
jgi:hypothetical protein